jgi:hypothetical protein
VEELGPGLALPVPGSPAAATGTPSPQLLCTQQNGMASQKVPDDLWVQVGCCLCSKSTVSKDLLAFLSLCNFAAIIFSCSRRARLAAYSSRHGWLCTILLPFLARTYSSLSRERSICLVLNQDCPAFSGQHYKDRKEGRAKSWQATILGHSTEMCSI